MTVSRYSHFNGWVQSSWFHTDLILHNFKITAKGGAAGDGFVYKKSQADFTVAVEVTRCLSASVPALANNSQIVLQISNSGIVLSYYVWSLCQERMTIVRASMVTVLMASLILRMKSFTAIVKKDTKETAASLLVS